MLTLLSPTLTILKVVSNITSSRLKKVRLSSPPALAEAKGHSSCPLCLMVGSAVSFMQALSVAAGSTFHMDVEA